MHQLAVFLAVVLRLGLVVALGAGEAGADGVAVRQVTLDPGEPLRAALVPAQHARHAGSVHLDQSVPQHVRFGRRERVHVDHAVKLDEVFLIPDDVSGFSGPFSWEVSCGPFRNQTGSKAGGKDCCVFEVKFWSEIGWSRGTGLRSHLSRESKSFETSYFLPIWV